MRKDRKAPRDVRVVEVNARTGGSAVFTIPAGGILTVTGMPTGRYRAHLSDPISTGIAIITDPNPPQTNLTPFTTKGAGAVGGVNVGVNVFNGLFETSFYVDPLGGCDNATMHFCCSNGAIAPTLFLQHLGYP